jgi:hypothetical protein
MTFDAIVAETQNRFKAGGFPAALEYLSTQPRELPIQLLQCRCLEDSQNLDAAESMYLEILETHTGMGTACPLGLLHYLGFIARTRSLEDALSFLDDLVLAESEHVTPDVFPAVAVGIVWQSPHLSAEDRLEQAVNVFKRGLGKSKGSKRTELIVSLSSFLAFSGNQLKLAQLELSAGPTHSVARRWEEILLEFNADIDTIKSMNKIFESKRDGNKSEQLVEDVSGVMTLSDHPESASDSWLIPKNEKVIKSVMDKFRIGNDMYAPSSVLEAVIGEPEKSGQLDDTDKDELMDGGVDATNHFFRPDVTKMLKYFPAEDMERKAEIPTVLRNLLALLPDRTLKHANTQYIAEQCVRLLVSITMPPRLITEEQYDRADKRARAAYELKYVKQVPTAITTTAPVVLTKKPEEEAAQRVKKEQY